MRKHYEILGQPHCVYRFWRGKRLLYVGCTYTFPQRFAHHSVVKSWFKEVDRITLEWHPDFLQGRLAETKAIETEKPKYN